MSLREDVVQLSQVLHGWDMIARRGADYRLTDLARATFDAGGVGAIYGMFRADPWSGRDWSTGIVPEARAEVAAMVQEAARAATGGTGVFLVEEAPHGLQALGSTFLPTNLAQGATWHPELAAEAADLVGRATRADGIHLVLASGLDMLRDPRWGRSEECFTEAPGYAADHVTALVTGMQGGPAGGDPRTHPGVVAKHFAAQGDALGGRNGGSACIGPREVAEIHLPPCRAAVEAGVVAFMAAYNDIDGTPCIANPWLLSTLLREEWGFEGVVMADAYAIDRYGEGIGLRRAAFASLRAGVDMNMGDECWAHLYEAADEGPDAVAAIERAAARVRALKGRFGLLPGQTEAWPVKPDPAALEASSAALARECLTLLSGDLPPLTPGASVLVTGPHAQDPIAPLGDYVSPPAPGTLDSIATTLCARWPNTAATPWDSDASREAAERSDVVVAVVGGSSERPWEGEFHTTGATKSGTAATCGEGVDHADLDLPGGQDAALERLAEATRAGGGRLVVVAVMGRPHVLTTAARVADDVLVAWYPGPFGAGAIGDVLDGTADPCGRLPVTMLRAPGAAPWHDDDRVGRVEPTYVDTPAGPALYRLGEGHGRHRTRLRTADVTRSGGRTVVDVRYEADRPGVDVLHLFARRHGETTWPRRRVLLAWHRVEVGPVPGCVRWELDDDEVFGAEATSAVLTVPALRVEARVERS